MKKTTAFILFVSVCLSMLSGCSLIRRGEGEIINIVSDIVENLNKPREFIRIPAESGKGIYTADMKDDHTVVMIMQGETDDGYQIVTYDLETGRLTQECTGTFQKGDGAFGFYSIETLSADPLVICDYVNELAYRFSKDYLAAQVLNIGDIDFSSMAYSRKRDSLIYTVNTDYACELAEYSFAQSKTNTLLDLGDVFAYISLDQLVDEGRVAVLQGNKLFSEEYVYFMADMETLEIIGETTDQYSYYTHDSGAELVKYDLDRGAFVAGTMKYDGGRTFSSELHDLTGGTDGFLSLDAGVIGTDGSLYYITEDDRMFEFKSNDGSSCGVTAYDLFDGTVICRSDFDYSQFGDIQFEPSDDTGEIQNVYIKGSLQNSYDSGYLVFGIVGDEYMGAVFVWNTNAAERLDEPISETDKVEFRLSSPNNERPYDSNTEYAESLEEEYGISIFYGDAADIEFVDYDVEMVYNDRDIYSGLRDLETALKLFPDGFFFEFSNSNYLRGINFYLCGEAHSTGDESVAMPAAFTYTSSGYAMVVMNVLNDGSNVSNFCHEISHVIDTRLISEDRLTDEEWCALNPADFEYNYSYVDGEGVEYEETADQKYTSWDDNYYRTDDSDYVYFVDAYSKTFPTEDRARLFENAILSDDYLPQYFESVHIQAKLKYYFSCIRDCWDTEGWPETTCWENALQD
ncbi:MAG: hypothetical protein IJL71_00105 [Oscillospiraceae bacterium]|nr:hypothetical protein [Oscillospiraceae bacterium]